MARKRLVAFFFTTLQVFLLERANLGYQGMQLVQEKGMSGNGPDRPGLSGCHSSSADSGQLLEERQKIDLKPQKMAQSSVPAEIR